MGGNSSPFTVLISGMVFHLSSHAVNAGYRVESFGRVESTSVLAAEIAKNGDRGKVWVVADEQTAGRARRGRVWVSRPGNLYATLLLVDDFNPGQAATLGFVAGVSLIEALGRVMPEVVLTAQAVKLKWPNDVLADGAKLAGILLELVPLDSRYNAIMIGIGVNVTGSPAGLPYPATSLRQIGVDCSPADVFEALSHIWVDNCRVWDRGIGLDTIRGKWLQHAANLGQNVHVTIDGDMVSGIFETIDHNCHFILRKDDGQKITIPTGDVYFGTVASVHTQS